LALGDLKYAREGYCCATAVSPQPAKPAVAGHQQKRHKIPATRNAGAYKQNSAHVQVPSSIFQLNLISIDSNILSLSASFLLDQ
jgi:hypothetical protein